MDMKVSKPGGYLAFAAAAVVSTIVLTGCHGPKFAELPGTPGATTVSAASGPDMSAPPAGQRGNLDTILVGDNLKIVFSDLPTPVLPFEDRVREDGTIMLLQNQAFVAAGKMRGDLEKEIRARYVPNFFKTMTVSVTQQKDTQFYYVDGDVKEPGRQVYISRITVLKAIASAKGFTDYARRGKVVLTRSDGRTINIDCIEAIRNPKLDLEVYPGDKIYVKRRTPWQR